jgi:hypothetical protein
MVDVYGSAWMKLSDASQELCLLHVASVLWLLQN